MVVVAVVGYLWYLVVVDFSPFFSPYLSPPIFSPRKRAMSLSVAHPKPLSAHLVLGHRDRGLARRLDGIQTRRRAWRFKFSIWLTFCYFTNNVSQTVLNNSCVNVILNNTFIYEFVSHCFTTYHCRWFRTQVMPWQACHRFWFSGSSLASSARWGQTACQQDPE